MSLLSDAMEKCMMLHKTTVDDPYGGDGLVSWVYGASFKAAITFDASIQARIGQAQGVSSRYLVTTPRSKTLEYHEVFIRERDNKVFRVTSDGDDVATPRSTSLDMRLVTAEEFVPVGFAPK